MRQPKHDLVPNHRAWQAPAKSRVRHAETSGERGADARHALGRVPLGPAYLGRLLRPRRRQTLLREGARLRAAVHARPRAFRHRRGARTESEGREGGTEAPDPSVDRLRKMRGVQGWAGELLRLG